VSPLATLQRGYAIVTNAAGRVVSDSASMQAGDMLHARLARGIVHARVEGATPSPGTSEHQNTSE
jgi:exodeoxyribonuclease VII large subunit